MAGLPWFELDTDFHESPKVKALAVRLREPLADAYIARVYAYCYRHARDRFDPDVAAQTIEDAAVWKGRRGVLFDALFAAEVLERDAGKVVVHGVAERLAPHIAKRLGDAERQRRRRDRAATSIGRPPDVTRDVTRESRRDKDKDRDKDTNPSVSVQLKTVPLRWWERLTAEERTEYLLQRSAIDPELADAPFGATGEKHHAEVEDLHRRWAARVQRKASA